MKMTDLTYKNMILRRRYCKRILLAAIICGVTIYVSVLLFGDLRTPRVMNLSALDRCPACYGVSVCPELYSNKIGLETRLDFSSIFNAKNVYYGYTKSNRKVVLKKLAHDWELKELDANLCDIWGLKSNCKPMETIQSKNIDKEIIKLVHYNVTEPNLEPRKGLVMCPYSYSFNDFVKPVLNKKTNVQFDSMYVWTMLKINPEPIILQVLQKANGWPVPAYGGVCGRLELVGNEGEPLSSLLHVEWPRRLRYAKHILDAAMDFTFKHERYRFYLMDWSIDNIVANTNDFITFVDLEDIIVLDKHITPQNDLPDWYKRYNREADSGFTFSIHELCRHHLSDHNIWAACYVIYGPENPLLHPIPDRINVTQPHLDFLFKQCLNGNDRFQTVTKLQSIIKDMLSDQNIHDIG